MCCVCACVACVCSAPCEVCMELSAGDHMCLAVAHRQAPVSGCGWAQFGNQHNSVLESILGALLPGHASLWRKPQGHAQHPHPWTRSPGSSPTWWGGLGVDLTPLAFHRGPRVAPRWPPLAIAVQGRCTGSTGARCLVAGKLRAVAQGSGSGFSPWAAAGGGTPSGRGRGRGPGLGQQAFSRACPAGGMNGGVSLLM